MSLGYAKIVDLTKRWVVDRQTARAAIAQSGIGKSEAHASPRYRWQDILTVIEGWPRDVVADVDLSDTLCRAEDLAKTLGVSAQTIRNYGRDGRLHEVRLSSRALRYGTFSPCENKVR